MSKKPKNVTVTVTVDTDRIEQSNVTETIVLTDDNGGRDQKPGDSSTFSSQINNGARVTFVPAAKNGKECLVTFTKFEKKGECPDVMEPMPCSPKWKARVGGDQKDCESYTIHVSVLDKGDFFLDPKVVVTGP